MKRIKVCVVGSGAREHALQLVLSRHADVVVTPGNPGIPGSMNVDPLDIEADLFVIGPEQPLVEGLADRLRAQGKRVFGPGADGAQIEGSKAWMKDLLSAAGVPTAGYRVVRSEKEAEEALWYLGKGLFYQGWAIKTSGLAAGKGVKVTRDHRVAMQDVRDKLAGSFGEAGKTLVIEGLLASKSGTPAYEVSLFAICNGEDYVLLEGAQDYKLLSAGSDLNTGGMGAYSPTRDQDKLAEWAEIVVRPVLRELRRRGIDYRGVLYFGLMIVDGQPHVVEINIRLGDPEAGVVLPRITSNFVELLMQAAAGEPMSPPTFSSDIFLGRVLAAEGYPGKPRTGDVIKGLEAARQVPGVTILCAGVSTNADGELVTAGGRVLLVVASAETAELAISRMNEAAGCVTWPGIQSRDDIGLELLAA